MCKESCPQGPRSVGLQGCGRKRTGVESTERDFVGLEGSVLGGRRNMEEPSVVKGTFPPGEPRFV